jgi:hypothetical protein
MVAGMIRLSLVVPCCLALLLAAAPASAHYKPRGKDCGAIAFTPQTDEGASDIHAKNITCKRARRIVRIWHNGDESPRDFTCRARDHDDPNGLAHQDVVCRRGERRVSWAET